MEFTKVDPVTAQKLKQALRANAERGAPLKMDPLTTGWAPGEDEKVSEDDQVLNAIMSVPCHY